jgi:hypothetical protein
MEGFISLHLNKGLLSNGIKVNTLIIFHVATECNLGCTLYHEFCKRLAPCQHIGIFN